MAYIGSSPTKVVSRQSANIFTYTATVNQTAFTGADANGNTLACTPSDIMVHMNGLRLEKSDYVATTTTVTLGSGAAAGDEVTITAFVTFETADAYTKSASDTRYVNTTGDTMTGALTVDAAAATPLIVDRATSAGTTIDVQKDGTSMATIGSSGSAGTIVLNTNGSSGVGLFGSTNNGGCLLPTNGSASALDNAKDLGRSDIRWRNIYLSGGVYLGGTGAANKLDDYEEGTWTPTSGVTHTYNYASYTKIGQLVFLNMDVNCGSSSSTSALVFSTPFQANVNYSTGSFNYQTTSLNDATINLGPNGIYFRTGQSGGDMNYNQASNARLIFNAIYHTNA